MPEPKFKIGDTIDCDAITGWIVSIYERKLADRIDLPQYIYGVEEPESESIFYFTESELS